MKKRFLALALSAVMVLGMSTAAFADETTGDMSEAFVEKAYELEGEGNSPAETFTLTMEKSKVEKSDATAAPTVKVDPVEYTAEDKATTAGNVKKFKFNLPDAAYNGTGYTNPGVYTYTYKETKGTTPGVTYSEDTIKLVVYVTDESGKLVRQARVYVNDEKIDGENDKGDITNKYTANKLSVKKTVTGNLGDTKKEFAFTVKFTGPEGWTKDTVVIGAGSAVTPVWNDTTATFKLSHDKTVTFENIPAGVTYEVVEDDANKDDYTTTYDKSETGTMDKDAKSTVVTNNKETEVDTGINLDNMPYVMILVVLAGAAFALVVAKKRREE